jgi:hypothetical protein
VNWTWQNRKQTEVSFLGEEYVRKHEFMWQHKGGTRDDATGVAVKAMK